MPLFDNPVVTSVFIDQETKTVRPAAAILKQNGWRFLQDGRYTPSNVLAINDGVKTKITFDLAQIAYTVGENLSLNYNQSLNRFFPTELNAAYLVSFRFKVKPSAQAGLMDIILECPGAAFNPIIQETDTFSKSAGTEHFFSITNPLFVSQDLITNGLELYIKPQDCNLQMYDYSIFVQKTYIP